MVASRAQCRILGLLLLAASTHGAVSARQVQEVTPLEKVVELLKRLEVKTTEEGKVDAAQYDKYSCFCKEQADGKLYAIEKSQKKIEKMNAQINLLGAEISELNGKIKDLASEISDLEGAIEKAVATRATEHAGYLKEAANMDGAIVAIAGAIEAMKNSKADMTDAKLDFAQLRALVGQVLQTVRHSSSVQPSKAQLAAVTVLLGEGQSPAAYAYHSNDIIATLEGLIVQFKDNKKELDGDEFDTNSAFEKHKLNMENQKKFAEKEKAETEEIVGMKEAEVATTQADLEAETNDKAADQKFLGELTGACEAKAKLFDQRSTTRAAELTAITEAISALESGVAPNFGANKKLVDLQRGPTAAVAKAGGSSRAPSFLQRGSASSGDKAPLNRALQLLENAAQHLGSPLLATLSVKVRVQIDHFVEVRGLIKDFIARLEADALAEADQKAYCDKEMKLATEERDHQSALIEKLEAEIKVAETDIARLNAEISTLSAQIAENYKALHEAEELRAAEKAANAKTLADAQEGLDAVKFAISVLEDFYAKAFLQRSGRYTPPNADREGQTVSDLAPEVFEGEYHGGQDASKGIIGILEIITSDFERTIETVTTEEKEAQEEFELFVTDVKADIADKEKSKSEKEGQVANRTEDLSELKDQHADAKKTLDVALSELEKLKSMCVDGEESSEERRAKRAEEIEALKEAMRILDEWKS